jgi:hypothetical protein
MRAIGPSRKEIVIAALANDRSERQLLLAAGALLGRGNPLPLKDTRIAGAARRLERLEEIAGFFPFQESEREKSHNHCDRGKLKNFETPVQHN